MNTNNFDFIKAFEDYLQLENMFMSSSKGEQELILKWVTKKDFFRIPLMGNLMMAVYRTNLIGDEQDISFIYTADENKKLIEARFMNTEVSDTLEKEFKKVFAN